jgi:hypothetical protein
VRVPAEWLTPLGKLAFLSRSFVLVICLKLYFLVSSKEILLCLLSIEDILILFWLGLDEKGLFFQICT